MGLTIAQKIIKEHLISGDMTVGSEVALRIDQTLTQDATGANPTTSEGLSLLRRYYTVSYEKGQGKVPLDEGSDEMVIKLILWRRTASESFRNIKMSIDPDTKLIRRIVATTPGGVVYQFDFKNYEINQGLTAKRFEYDIPSGANNYDNFLFAD